MTYPHGPTAAPRRPTPLLVPKPAPEPDTCAHCQRVGHYKAYHDVQKRPLPWLATSYCRAWDPESPDGKCRCRGWQPKERVVVEVPRE